MHHLIDRLVNRANGIRMLVWVTATLLVLTLAHVATDVPAHDRRVAADAPVTAQADVAAGNALLPSLALPHTYLIEPDAPQRTGDGRAGHRSDDRAGQRKGVSHGKRVASRHKAGHRTARHPRRHPARHAGKSKPHAHGASRGKSVHPGKAGHRHPAKRAARAVPHQVRRAHPRPRKVHVWGGRDISWPQCPPNVGIPDLKGLSQPLPEPGVRFVVVGLTNGRGFTRNPCLARHLDWVRRHHVWAAAYAFTTYPTVSQLKRYRHAGPFDGNVFGGKLRNAGYAAARFNIRTMQDHGFRSPHVWLDVEPSSSRPWSGRPDWNRAVVEGWVRAYHDAGYRVGFYSTRSIWRQILGGWRTRLPEWRTAGPDSAEAALGRCYESSFQGGHAVVAQWWNSDRDFDRMCPGFKRPSQMQKFFRKY